MGNHLAHNVTSKTIKQSDEPVNDSVGVGLV